MISSIATTTATARTVVLLVLLLLLRVIAASLETVEGPRTAMRGGQGISCHCRRCATISPISASASRRTDPVRRRRRRGHGNCRGHIRSGIVGGIIVVVEELLFRGGCGSGSEGGGGGGSLPRRRIGVIVDVQSMRLLFRAAAGGRRRRRCHRRRSPSGNTVGRCHSGNGRRVLLLQPPATGRLFGHHGSSMKQRRTGWQSHRSPSSDSDSPYSHSSSRHETQLSILHGIVIGRIWRIQQMMTVMNYHVGMMVVMMVWRRMVVRREGTVFG
mmetsp:Transcript_31009/g.65622  ORF Transcript_31009/g.65622 Transcript_31009/m.65622 type:complete len:271 (+) Transcript_31009:145-957(+)